MEALAGDGNYLGCLCSEAVLDLLVHDGRFLFAEVSPAETVFHTSPICQEMLCRRPLPEATVLAVVFTAGQVYLPLCKCVSLPFSDDVDAVSIRFGATAWREFAENDEELRVIMMEEGDLGTVHTVDCMLPEDGRDGECVLCMLEEVDAAATHLEAELNDCDCAENLLI